MTNNNEADCPRCPPGCAMCHISGNLCDFCFDGRPPDDNTEAGCSRIPLGCYATEFDDSSQCYICQVGLEVQEDGFYA